ncbi:hypothetical protein EHS14_00105 [Schaalia georgiae]|nr:hypothetical protein EHS14_00105 [Schaalia georgiae]
MFTESVRDVKDDDVVWEKKKREYVLLEMLYIFENKKWFIVNKTCMVFIKNIIEYVIVGLIAECVFVGEYFEKIKSKFTGFLKIYVI